MTPLRVNQTGNQERFDKASDVLRKTLERVDHRLAFDEAASLAEGYLKGHTRLILHLVENPREMVRPPVQLGEIRKLKHYVAVLEGVVPFALRKGELQDGTEQVSDREATNGRANRNEKVVLVLDVELLELPVTIARPAFVRFGLADQLAGITARGFYLSKTGVESESGFGPVDGEVQVPAGGSPFLNDSEGQVVQNGPKIVYRVPDHDSQLGRRIFTDADPCEDCPRFTVAISKRRVWAGLDEGVHGSFKLRDVTIGPFELQNSVLVPVGHGAVAEAER